MAKAKTDRIAVKAPRFEKAVFRLIGDSPYVQHKFSTKVMRQIAEQHEAGQRARKNKAKEARDFDAEFQSCLHRLPDGGYGIPASGFRDGLISACRLVGFKMTIAKLSVFIIPDGYDQEDGTPLIRLEGEPKAFTSPVRLSTGVIDIRCRPIFSNWAANVTVMWDADQFSVEDVTNLFARMGAQVGIGEGRADSKNSNGQGWGFFHVESVTELVEENRGAET